jgi:hypothetical protein
MVSAKTIRLPEKLIRTSGIASAQNQPARSLPGKSNVRPTDKTLFNAAKKRGWTSAMPTLLEYGEGWAVGQPGFSGTFYNPWHHRNEIDGSKVLMFHAKDDPNVPYRRTKKFAEITGAKLKTLQRGGHISTDYVTSKYWADIKKFFDSV